MSQHDRYRITPALAVAPLLLFAIRMIPLEGLADRTQVILQGSAAVLGALILVTWIGWCAGDHLLPQAWVRHESTLMPMVGFVVLVPFSYFANFFINVRDATILLALLSTPFGIIRFRRGSNTPSIARAEAIVASLATILCIAGLFPHVIQGSLALLANNTDDETYFHLASYLLQYPAGLGAPGPFSPILGQSTDAFRAEGWGFQYLLGAATVVSGVDPFSAYMPTTYLLLALSIPTWYLFFREALGISSRKALVAVALYACHGLPLWFASFGYARQIAWLCLVPLVLSGIIHVLRTNDRKPILFASMATAAMFATESRVGAAQLGLVAIGYIVVWLGRGLTSLQMFRLVQTAGLAAAIAAPSLWYSLKNYLFSGNGIPVLQSSQSSLSNWGPQLSGFPGFEVLVGLEPSELARIDSMKPSSLPGALDGGMAMVSPILAITVLLISAIGLIALLRHRPTVGSPVAAFFFLMMLTRIVLPFPYGYFKLFAPGAPFIIGLFLLGSSTVCRCIRSRRPHFRILNHEHRIVTACLALLLLFYARNSTYSGLFGARGWGLSIPQSMVNDVVHMGERIEPGARVFVTGSDRYPVPDDRILTRNDHRLALGSKEEIWVAWANRIHALISTNMIDKELYGVFRTTQWRWSTIRSDGEYDYAILNSDEDCRIHGLVPSDQIASTQGMALYKVPVTASLTSRQIQSNRGSLLVDGNSPLEVTASTNGISLGTSSSNVLRGRGRVQIGLISLSEAQVTIDAGGEKRTILLDPGLSWYSTETLPMPARLRIQPSGDEALRVVSIRTLPAGEEALDRSEDTIMSSVATIGQGNVDVDLWLCNPMRDAKSAAARLVTEIGNQSTLAQLSVGTATTSDEKPIGLEVGSQAQHWLFRFPLDGGDTRQIKDGVQEVPMDPLPWISQGGGTLSLRFRLGHERPRQVPLARLDLSSGEVRALSSYSDPVQLRLWGYDDRPAEKQSPDLTAINGRLVQGPEGTSFIIEDGVRHWVPDGTASFASTPRLRVTGEQLWAIPPGLPYR